MRLACGLRRAWCVERVRVMCSMLRASLVRRRTKRHTNNKKSNGGVRAVLRDAARLVVGRWCAAGLSCCGLGSSACVRLVGARVARLLLRWPRFQRAAVYRDRIDAHLDGLRGYGVHAACVLSLRCGLHAQLAWCALRAGCMRGMYMRFVCCSLYAWIAAYVEVCAACERRGVHA